MSRYVKGKLSQLRQFITKIVNSSFEIGVEAGVEMPKIVEGQSEILLELITRSHAIVDQLKRCLTIVIVIT